LAAAREKGRVGGRKAGLSKSAINKAHAALHFSKQKAVLKQLGISKSTYYRYIEFAKNDVGRKKESRRKKQ
jgi:DNA invertase Pin-like site-specific DNA recombinase